MWDDAQHFRKRAQHCWQLAETARGAEDRRLLIEMAKEFEAEAEVIEKREGQAAQE